MSVLVEGSCTGRFAALRDAFEAAFDAEIEDGASVALYHRGVCVADLWGGVADVGSGVPWCRDTLVNVYSTTKPTLAVLAQRLVDRGALDLDAPVARYWPEFAAAGKQSVRVRHLLCHQSGVAGFEAPRRVEDLYDWRVVTEALAAQAPWWEPGTRHGYHAITFGYLVGEVLRRIDGRSPGTQFREDVARPLGLDFHVGLPATEDARVARLVPPRDGEGARILREEPGSLTARVLSNPVIDPRVAGTRAWRGAEIPAANGHANARAIARMYAALAEGGCLDGLRIVSEGAVHRLQEIQARGVDAVLRIDVRWGPGVVHSGESGLYGPDPRAFGHGGFGGSFGFADPGARLAMGYAMNRMGTNLVSDGRAAALVAAAYASL